MSTRPELENLADELERLADLHEKGHLSATQFETAKQRFLSDVGARSSAVGSSRRPDSDIVETYVKLRFAGWIVSGILGVIFFVAEVLPFLLGKEFPILFLFD